MGIGQPSFLHSAEGTPSGEPSQPTGDLAALTQELGTSAVNVLEESFPKVTRGYDEMLSLVKTLTASDTAGVDFAALEASYARSVDRPVSGLPRFLCDLVFNDENVVERPDFREIYRLLLLYVGRLPSRVPGFYYKRGAAEDFVNTEGTDREVPFTGFHYLPKTCLLRFDIKGSVKKRLEQGLDVGTTESHYYYPILEALKTFSAVHYVETAGDETVFLCDDPEAALEFAQEAQRRFVAGFGAIQGSELAVEMGITLNGPAYWGITTDGRFIVGGPSYERAGQIQKLGKLRGADDLGAASGIFVYDFETPPADINGTPSLEEYEDEQGGASSTFGPLVTGTTTLLPGSALRVETIDEDSGVSSVSMRRLSGKDPQLLGKLQKILALLASTATDPEGALLDSDLLYPTSTILFLNFFPPVPNSEDQPNEDELQASWEVFMAPIEEIVCRYDGVVLYNCSEGKVIVLMGAFKSSPLRQEERALLCGEELKARFPNLLRRAACHQGRFGQGPMAGSVNGAGVDIDFPARLLGVDAPGRLVMERSFFEKVFAQSGLLFLNDQTGTYEVRDFGSRELVSFDGVKAPALSLSSGIEYAELLKALSAHIQSLIKTGSTPGVHLFYTKADLGVSPDAFLEPLKAALSREGATVFSPSEAVQPHRAYGFFREVLNSVFPSPGDFEQFLARHHGPHEVWRFLFREISSGRISPTLLQNAELILDSLCSLLRAAASDRSLVLELPAWNRLDAFSAAVLEALLRQPAVGHLVFLSAEPLLLEGLATPPAAIPLSCLDESGFRTVLAAELGVAADSFPSEVVGFYERMIGAAPWVPFLVRSLTSFLLQEKYFARGKSGFLKSPDALSPADVPGSFEHYTHSLYAGLSPHGKELFRAAALFGARGEVSVLRVLADFDDAQFAGAMAELHQAGIVQIVGKQYRFSHDFIPQIAPRLFVEAGSTSAINERILTDLCSLADRNPLAIAPNVLMEKAREAGFPQWVAPQIAEALEAMVRDLPLDAEMLAQQFLSSLEGIELSPEQKEAVLRVNMHLILAKAQLRRPYDEVVERPLIKCKQEIRVFCQNSEPSLLAELGVLLEDVGYIYRLKDVAEEGIKSLIALDSRMSSYDSSLRSGIEFAKARYKYQNEVVPSGIPLQERCSSGEGVVGRLQSILDFLDEQLSSYDYERLKALMFTIRGFLAIQLLNESLQGPSPRAASGQEKSVIRDLVTGASRFFDGARELSFRQIMDYANIFSMGNSLIGDFKSAHDVLDPLLARAEQDGQLGLHVRLVNLKITALGFEMDSLLKKGDFELVRRLWQAVQPFKHFVEAHRAFLIKGDDDLLVFYRNLVEINAMCYKALPPEDPARSQLYESSFYIVNVRMLADCGRYMETRKRLFDLAATYLSSMQPNGL